MKKVICLSIIVLLIIGFILYKYLDKSYLPDVYSSKGSCLYSIKISEDGKNLDVKNISPDIYEDASDNTILEIMNKVYFRKVIFYKNTSGNYISVSVVSDKERYKNGTIDITWNFTFYENGIVYIENLSGTSFKTGYYKIHNKDVRSKYYKLIKEHSYKIKETMNDKNIE